MFIFTSMGAYAQVDAGELRQDVLFSESAGFPMNEVVCRRGACTPGGMKPNQIALTFDDGPSSKTLKILEILDRYRIKATFFVHIGQRSSAQKKSILERIVRAGHKVSNHGAVHSPLNRSTSFENVERHLMDTHEVISPYYRANDIPLFRNPGGYWSRSRAQGLNAHSVLRSYVGPIFWNVGGDNRYEKGVMLEAADWRCQSNRISAEDCATGYYVKILSNYYNNTGSLVLMHDIHSVTNRMLPILLEQLFATALNWEFIFVQDIPAVRQMRRSI